jgi:hypothetical protein
LRIERLFDLSPIVLGHRGKHFANSPHALDAIRLGKALENPLPGFGSAEDRNFFRLP